MNSLLNQTDKNFRLFLACHNLPEMPIDTRLPITFCEANIEGKIDTTLVLADYENIDIFNLDLSTIHFDLKPFDCPMTDMSRKTILASFSAIRYAIRMGVKEFWMLRMDSDDFLGKDIIEQLNKIDTKKFQGIWNRKCHMLDISTDKFGIAIHPYSTTTAAVHFKIDFENKIINLPWHFLAYNHTKLFSRMNDFKIKTKEIDWTMTISCNSGNHISGRPTIQKEGFFKELIPLTPELRDRYGL